LLGRFAKDLEEFGGFGKGDVAQADVVHLAKQCVGKPPVS
jgi:hypothetical protein